MESLLPYYERELTFLRRLSHDFARRYPKVAGQLLLSGETCEDPHIERLIESFAFLSGRIHKKLDDDYPEFTESLLQVLFPHYLRPFPSVSIAQFENPAAFSGEGSFLKIPRKTLLETCAVRGVVCKFRTAYDVEIKPLSVTRAAHENVFNTEGLKASTIRQIETVICLEMAFQADFLPTKVAQLGKIRFYLNGEPALVALIRDALFSRVSSIWISCPASSEKIEITADLIKPVGFSEDDSLLDADARSHHAYQLLLEYFAFPEKFNFFDLDLSAVQGKIPASLGVVEIRIGLRGAGTRDGAEALLDRINKDNFVLGATPIVNLFRKKPEPIRMNEKTTAYPLIVDNRRPYAYEVHEIKRVFQVSQGSENEEIREFGCFYSIQHREGIDKAARYWHVSYLEGEKDENSMLQLSIVDSAQSPHCDEIHTLSLDLVCTNGDLPSQLPYGLLAGDLTAVDGNSTKTIRMLRKPTTTYRFPRGRGAQWRLISCLSLNHLSLAGPEIDALRESLFLYDITRSVANARQIGGMVALERHPVMAKMAGNPFPVFVRGIEICLTIDESHYAGIGLFTFTQILDYFFGLYVHANSFTQLVVISKQSGQELIKCRPRHGASILV